MTAPYDHDALWMKARLFINHALDDEPRTFDEEALWASLALELLAKAALARVSPLLIATPTEDGTNLLIAAGLVEGRPEFKSIPAHTLYNRCGKSFKPFNESEAKQITASRNDYLHGAIPHFTLLPSKAWWPRYWAQAVILINALDRTLEEFVGPDRQGDVEAHLASNKKNIEHRVEMLLERARQRLAQYRSGQMSEKIAAEWRRETHLTAGLEYSASEACPACGSEGQVEGSDVVSDEIRYERLSEEDYDSWVDLTVGTDYFSCPTCHLVLESLDLAVAAGVPDTFATIAETTGDWLNEDAEYGND